MEKGGLKKLVLKTELLPGDAGRVTALHGQVYHSEYGYNIAFEAYVARGISEYILTADMLKSRTWMLEYENALAGFIALVNKGDAAQLRFFIVHPRFRRMGIGTMLMDLFMDFYKQCSYATAFLWTTGDLEGAAALYIKYGFRCAEEIDSERFGRPVKEQKYILS